MKPGDVIGIGELAARTGVSVAALRFYEDKGLLSPFRSGGRHRRFLRSDVRRVSFVRIAQGLGLTIGEIRALLALLPAGRTPTAADWRRIGRAIAGDIDRRIDELRRVRARLDGCIGCGCLSLKACALYNPEDRAAARGAGPRFVLGEPD